VENDEERKTEDRNLNERPLNAKLEVRTLLLL